MRVAVLTISDAGARGERSDSSGDAIVAWAGARGHVVTERALVADESGQIASRLLRWCDGDVADVVLTTGGTGLSPRDVTPEATLAVVEREVPGIAERIRGLAITTFPRAALSRGVAGVRARTLIVNLPGSPSGVRDALAALEPIVEHGVDVLRGVVGHHDAGGGAGEGGDTAGAPGHGPKAGAAAARGGGAHAATTPKGGRR